MVEVQLIVTLGDLSVVVVDPPWGSAGVNKGRGVLLPNRPLLFTLFSGQDFCLPVQIAEEATG